MDKQIKYWSFICYILIICYIPGTAVDTGDETVTEAWFLSWLAAQARCIFFFLKHCHSYQNIKYQVPFQRGKLQLREIKRLVQSLTTCKKKMKNYTFDLQSVLFLWNSAESSGWLFDFIYKNVIFTHCFRSTSVYMKQLVLGFLLFCGEAT